MAKKHVRTHIQHHADKSHTMHRHYKHDDGTTSVESSAHHDLDGVHDGIQDHMGTPNPGEAQADLGQHGVPAAQAAPAGLPMPAPAAAPVPGA